MALGGLKTTEGAKHSFWKELSHFSYDLHNACMTSLSEISKLNVGKIFFKLAVCNIHCQIENLTDM